MKFNLKTNDYYNVIPYTSKTVELKSKEDDTITFIEQLKYKFITKNSETEEDFPDTENYATLLCGLLILVKDNCDKIKFQVVERQKKLLINLDKSIEFTDFQLFSKLFEEITLQRLHFENLEGVWKAELTL